MPTVTMIQKEQAVVGHEFIFNGPATQCQECRVKAACLNLNDGRRYRVARLRNLTHDCLLSGDLVRVVEVEAYAPPTSLEVNVAREGSTLAVQMRDCGEIFCENFGLCRPKGLCSGTKVRILEVGEKLDCPLGLRLVSAKVAYAEE